MKINIQCTNNCKNEQSMWRRLNCDIYRNFKGCCDYNQFKKLYWGYKTEKRPILLNLL